MHSSLLPADAHVHTQFSWDAARGDMERTCERALEIGLPGVVFTEHSDFVHVFDDQRSLDVDAYLECIERCRRRFTDLRVLAGVEMGEPHWFPDAAQDVLARGRFDRVLGSVHCTGTAGAAQDMSQAMPISEAPQETVRAYFAEVRRLVDSEQDFAVLAHLDYPKRYWRAANVQFREQDFEAEYREVLSAAARRGAVLEVNTTRGMDPDRGLCPGPIVLGWWREVGGEAVSFGSDAHSPDAIAKGFEHARQVVEAAGFKPAADPLDFWRR